MSRKIYDSDYRRLTLNQKIDGIRVDAVGIWPDDSAYSAEVLDSLTGEEAAALLERPDGWVPGQPYVRFPCTLEQLRHALGVYADAIDEDLATEYDTPGHEGSLPSLSKAIKDYLNVPIAALPAQLATFLKQRLDGIGVAYDQWDAATPEQRAAAASAADESVALLAQYERQDTEKQAEGRYTLEEAAEAIAASGERAKPMLEKLLAAANAGTLPVYGPGESARYQCAPDKPVRPYYQEAHWADLNKWRAMHEPRIKFCFPAPQQRTDSPLTEPPRTLEEQAEYDAARWELEIDASVWWSLSKISAIDAAMLLCGFNPNAPSAGNAENDTRYDDAGRQTGPAEFKRLRTVFCDVEGANPQSRTLQQWLALARERALTYHSWIDTWLAATGKDAPSVPTPSAEASQPSAVPDNAVRHILTRGKSVPLSAEVLEARSLAIDSDDTTSVWAELVKLAEKGMGSLIGHSSDGVQYRGAKYQATGEPDVFTQKNLRDRLKRAKARKGA